MTPTNPYPRVSTEGYIWVIAVSTVIRVACAGLHQIAENGGLQVNPVSLLGSDYFDCRKRVAKRIQSKRWQIL
jgi:hypothetical protein